jgi:hypothetical protein
VTVCEVPGCEVEQGRNRPVCSPHWAAVPGPIQQMWWRQYRSGDAFTVGWLHDIIVGYGVDAASETA